MLQGVLAISQRRIPCRFCFLLIQRQTAAVNRALKCSTSAFADNVEKLSNFQCIITPEDAIMSDLPKPSDKQIIDALTTFKQNELVRELAYEQGMSTKVFAICISKFQQYLVQSPGLPAELNYVMNEIVAGFRSPDDVFPYFLEHSKKIYPALQCFRDLQKISNLQNPANWYPLARQTPRKVIFHAGPTNSGKTYGATQAFFEAEVGIYAAPLRLLATEVYMKCKERDVKCDLITGEDQRFVNEDRSSCGHTACTVEMVDLQKVYDVAVIDEIQLLRDEQRGYAWTKALLGLPAKELHLCGEPAAIDLTRKLVNSCGDSFEVRNYDRLTPLCYDEKAIEKWDEIQKGDCIVAFSRNAIFTISRDLHKLGIKYAVIYGALPPKTKLEQARLFNDPNSDVNVLIASDAIGMGLNLSIRRIIFFSMTKVTRNETGVLVTEKVPQHLALQIAGRAGRYGSAYDIGHVTAFGQKNLDEFNVIARKPPTEVEKAGISPTFDQLEMFGYHLPGYSLKDLIEMFNLIAQLDENFFVSPSYEFKEIANLLASVDLPLQAKFKFCIAPANVNKSPLTATMLLKYAQRFSEGKAVRVGSIKNWIKYPLSPPKNVQALDSLEKINDSLELYCWLSYRFPAIFDDLPNVNALMNEVADLIEQGLTYLKLSKTESSSLKKQAHRNETKESRVAKLNQQLKEEAELQERYSMTSVLPSSVSFRKRSDYKISSIVQENTDNNLGECVNKVSDSENHSIEKRQSKSAELKGKKIDATKLPNYPKKVDASDQTNSIPSIDFSRLSANMKYGRGLKSTLQQAQKIGKNGSTNKELDSSEINESEVVKPKSYSNPLLPIQSNSIFQKPSVKTKVLRSHIQNALCMGYVKEFLLSAENSVRNRNYDIEDTDEIRNEVLARSSAKAGTPEFLDYNLTLWDSSFILCKVFSLFPSFTENVPDWEQTMANCESSLVPFIGREYFEKLKASLESDWAAPNGFQITNDTDERRFLNLFKGLAMKIEVDPDAEAKKYVDDINFVLKITELKTRKTNANRIHRSSETSLNTTKVSLNLYLVLSRLFPETFPDYYKVKIRRNLLGVVSSDPNDSLQSRGSTETFTAETPKFSEPSDGAESYSPTEYLASYTPWKNPNTKRTINRIHGSMQKNMQRDLARFLGLIINVWEKEAYPALHSWLDEMIRRPIVRFKRREDVQSLLIDLHLVEVYLWFTTKFPSLRYKLDEVQKKCQQMESELVPFVGEMYPSVFSLRNQPVTPSPNPKASYMFHKCVKKSAALLDSNYSFGETLESALNYKFLRLHLSNEIQQAQTLNSVETSIRDSLELLCQLNIKCPNAFGGYKENKHWTDLHEQLMKYSSDQMSELEKSSHSDSEVAYRPGNMKSTVIGPRMVRWRSFAEKIFSGGEQQSLQGSSGFSSTLDELLKSGRISREEYESIKNGMSEKN